MVAMCHQCQVAIIERYDSHMNKPRPALQAQDKFVIRLPEGMRDQIARAAEEAGRSMNAEIVYRLAKSLQEEGIGEIAAQIGSLHQKVEENPDYYRRLGKLLMDTLKQEAANADGSTATIGETARRMKAKREKKSQ